MNLDKFEKIINEAFDIKEKINANLKVLRDKGVVGVL